MVSLDDAVTAHIKKGSKEFEILVDPELALAFKRGDVLNVADVLAVESVFENASRGDKIADSDLVSTFQTDDVLKIAEIILKDGEIQLTKEQRKRFLEEKSVWLSRLFLKMLSIRRQWRRTRRSVLKLRWKKRKLISIR